MNIQTSIKVMNDVDFGNPTLWVETKCLSSISFHMPVGDGFKVVELNRDELEEFLYRTRPLKKVETP